MKELRSYYHIPISNWKVAALCRLFFCGASEAAFYISIGSCGTKTLFWKKSCFFEIYDNWVKNFCPCAEKLSWVGQNWILHAHRTILKKKKFFERFMVSLSHPDFELFNFLSTNFLREFQNRVLCEQSNISMKNFFLKIIRSFYYFFWNWMKKNSICQ